MNAAPPFTLVDASAQTFDAALPALVDLLQACVAGGASIGWPQPPSAAAAAAFWRGCITAATQGERRFWLALADAADPASVLGSTQLAFAGMPNGRHRADVMKVMVHPRARRQGLAEALMRHAEHEALAHGRWLLVLDTLAGSDAERLYARLGYQLCGRIPDYAELGDGRTAATTVMFKRLQPAGGARAG
jgi:acetyltransferase